MSTIPRFDLKVTEDDDYMRFTLSNINVSLSNGLRRTIMSDIPCYIFDTELREDNTCGCKFQINTTGKMHNEFLKHRLSCIPIHMPVDMGKSFEEDVLAGKYILEVDVQNNTDTMMYVTTGDFKIKNKTNGKYLTDNELAKLFPKNQKTGDHIIFARLRPKISDTILGEHIKFTCEIIRVMPSQNNACIPVSTIAATYTVDHKKADDAWDKVKQKLEADKTPTEEIEFKKRDFDFMDRYRYFVEGSFDFVMESVGVYTNRELVKMACKVLTKNFERLIENIDANGEDVVIIRGQSTMDNCYDVKLYFGDYTLGNIIEYFMYEQYFIREKTLVYCGHEKMHVHDVETLLRVAYKEPTDKALLKEHLKQACKNGAQFYAELGKAF
jgi:DNA-directed RNA polymerase subunit L